MIRLFSVSTVVFGIASIALLSKFVMKKQDDKTPIKHAMSEYLSHPKNKKPAAKAMTCTIITKASLFLTIYTFAVDRGIVQRLKLHLMLLFYIPIATFGIWYFPFVQGPPDFQAWLSNYIHYFFGGSSYLSFAHVSITLPKLLKPFVTSTIGFLDTEMLTTLGWVSLGLIVGILTTAELGFFGFFQRTYTLVTGLWIFCTCLFVSVT